MKVRTRFAPSPTGFLHIGGVRTALFNWLFARQHGGQFILRVDDTDADRHVEESLAPILEGFQWLGLDWDEGPNVGGPCSPYFQSQRDDLYQSAVKELLASGSAYRDFAKPEEIAEEREAAKTSGKAFVYSRRWMAEDEATADKYAAEGRQSVVRLKMPREGVITVDDRIRGSVDFACNQEQDHVIQRADGSVLYNLASVVDDHAMDITHVIRAEEHLANTPRQIFIFNALGYPLPVFAHIPFVAEPGSKVKLSKRKLDKYLKDREFAKLVKHAESILSRFRKPSEMDETSELNPVLVDFYRDIGFLPAALLNYLALLGWSLDDHHEDFTIADLQKHFTLERVQKGPASFDPAKLLSFQERWMAKLPIKQKTKMCLGFLQEAGLVPEKPDCDVGPLLTKVIEAAGDRIKVAGDILSFDEFFLANQDVPFDVKVLEKRLVNPERAVALLTEYRDELAQAKEFTTESLDAHLRDFCERKEIKFGNIIHAIRVAVTGKGVGIGMFDALAILGKENVLARIEYAFDRVIYLLEDNTK